MKKLGSMLSKTAEFSKIGNFKDFCRHCFRMSSTTFLVTTNGGDLLSFKKHRGRRLFMSAEFYVKEFFERKAFT